MPTNGRRIDRCKRGTANPRVFAVFVFCALKLCPPARHLAGVDAGGGQAALDCKPVSASHYRQYLELFGTLEAEKKLNAAQGRERAARIIVRTEHHFTLSLSLSLSFYFGGGVRSFD